MESVLCIQKKDVLGIDCINRLLPVFDDTRQSIATEMTSSSNLTVFLNLFIPSSHSFRLRLCSCLPVSYLLCCWLGCTLHISFDPISEIFLEHDSPAKCAT